MGRKLEMMEKLLRTKKLERELCYEMTPKKKTISHTFVNLIENIQKHNAEKI